MTTAQVLGVAGGQCGLSYQASSGVHVPSVCVVNVK